jgi:hypothetical protein
MLEHRIVDKSAGETIIKLEKSKAENSKIEFVL